MKRGILRFSEKVCDGLSRPEFKFVSQMLYGILSSQSCHLSKIARVLDEKTTLKKIIDRLSFNLNWLKNGEKLFDNYIRRIKGCISEKTILIVDDSDITKPCSSKLEGLGVVRDGSTGKLGIGYHTVGVTALTPGKKQPIGVYTRVYSAAEKGFVSADEETLRALRFLGKHFKKGNIRAFDRGYDANIYYEHLIKNKEKFIIRSKKNRDVIYKDERINILKLADKFKGKYSLKFTKKNGIQADCKISIVPVKLPCRPNEDLNLVICRGIGKEPLMLITNLKSDDKRLAVVVTKVYLMRWRIEEFYGFKKQQFDFEDFRVRSLNSIRNLDLLLTIAIGYIGYMSEKNDERAIVTEVITISKRIYGTPKFLFYAIADGLFAVFARCKQGVHDLLRKRVKSPQICLWSESRFAWG
ncbi:MAG: transposase [Oscillospiraceae bacterium]|nr:transposase [Oscillospiraceae bacterium]